jgi:hypothetical protein
MPDSGRGRLTPSKRKFLRAAAILQFAQVNVRRVGIYIDPPPAILAIPAIPSLSKMCMLKQLLRLQSKHWQLRSWIMAAAP